MNGIARCAGAAAAALAVTFASAAAPRAAAGGDAVYRCPDPAGGGVLYTNAPCKEGVKLDLLPGKADPAAIEKLRRDEEAWQRRQEAREAREFEREMRLAMMQPLPPPVYAYPDAASVYYPAYFPGYDGFAAPRRHADRGRAQGGRPPPQFGRGVVPAHPRNPALPPRR